MAVNAAFEWNIRTDGAATNGGGFRAGGTGTDYSLQAAAQKSGTDLEIHASDNTKVRPVAAGVAAADVNNGVNISAGSGFTTGDYEIVSQDGTWWTLDRAAGTLGSTGGTYAMGGAKVKPSNILVSGGPVVTGNTIHLKSGTYTDGPTAINGTTASPVRLIGYNATPRDYGTRPVIQSSGNSVHCMSQTGGAQISLYNVELDGNKATYTSTRGTNFVGGQCLLFGCVVKNCTTGLNAGTVAVYCWIKDCTTGATGCSLLYCVVSGCTAAITTSGTTIGLTFCLFYNCGNASTDVVTISNATSGIANCRFYNSGRDALSIGANCQIYNNIFSTSGRHHINYTTAQSQTGWRLNNAFYAATSGNINNDATNGPLIPTNKYGASDISLSAEPFTNPGSGDLSLNNTAGGGALCRATGWPQTLADGSLNYLDVGAVLQHQDAGGSSFAMVLEG